jgi:AraC-like DNA-binding protein
VEHEHDFWNHFHPYVWSITQRGIPLWEEMNFVFGEHTKIHKFSYFYGGEGRIEYNDDETALTPGMIVYSSPGNWIQLTSSRHDPLRFYSVMFDYALVKWEGWNVRCLHREQREQKLPLDNLIHVKQRSLVAGIVQQMHSYWVKKAIGYDWKVKLGFMNLLSELKSQQVQAKGEDASLDLIHKAIAYINDHYREPIDRKALADHVSLSHSHLSLLFKKYTGWSPVQYVIKIRMDKAKELLRDSRKSISHIASEVGYPDPLYFSRVFAKETGLSPRDYRNS